MKKLNVLSLLLGVALFTSVGLTSSSADGMKCGAGKCGASMNKPAQKCGGDKKTAPKKAMKCGTGKCGDTMNKPVSKCGGDKQPAPKEAMKCGTGKCG